jgi:hypothetical protein
MKLTRRFRQFESAAGGVSFGLRQAEPDLRNTELYAAGHIAPKMAAVMTA